MTSAPSRLAAFVRDVSQLLDAAPAEPDLLRGGRRLVGALVAEDDWLPAAYAEPDPDRYRQYLLYSDPRARFSLVSFVWGPGQSTPIHDHTVWGLIGVLRGAELSQRFAVSGSGPPRPLGVSERLAQGAVDAVSPDVGDVHSVANAHDDRASVSIHLYGADIGAVRRWTYPKEGGRKPFVSGYSNTPATPPFDLDAESRAA